MASVRVNHVNAFRYSRQVSEKQIRRALTDMKIKAVEILSTGPYVTGRHLIPALDLDVRVEVEQVVGRLSCHHPAAMAVEGGARSHYITPNPPRNMLKFYWRKIGRTVRLPYVYHPGQKGKHFLTKPLVEVAPRFNMLVFVYHR